MSTNDDEKRNKGKGRFKNVFSKRRTKEPIFADQKRDLKSLLEQKGIQLKPRSTATRSSKLSPKLSEVLKMPILLGEFIDYLREQQQKYFFDFWLEIATLCQSKRSPSDLLCTASASQLNLESVQGNSRTCFRTSSCSSSSSVRQGSLTEESPSNTETVKPFRNNCSKCLFQSQSEIDDCSGDTETPLLQSNCTCSIQDNEIQYIEKTKTLTLIDIQGSSDKKDQIDSMHPTNHEWGKEKDVLGTVESLEGNLNVSDSLHFQKSKSASSSLDEIQKPFMTLFNDAIDIFGKYNSISFEFPAELKRYIEDALKMKDSGDYNLDCIKLAQNALFHELSSFYELFKHSPSMINYQIRLLTEKRIVFVDIFNDENILFVFMEFLDQLSCRSVLEFIITVQNFEDDLEIKLSKTDEYTMEETVKDAMNIYEKYFSMKCKEQLIEDDKLRIVLENNICREDGPQPNCFCIPATYAWTALSDIYTPNFLESEIYSSYIEHLHRSIHSLKKGPSRLTCIPPVSLEDSAIPLTLEDPKFDLLDENNLEEFWFKKSIDSPSGLCLGHVNEFGIFNSEMQPEPENIKEGDSSVSKFGKAMRNLLRRETSEETEQLAWRRAEKIIADIQKQTKTSENKKIGLL